MSPARTDITTDADRFWAKVDRTGDCWTWRGSTDAHGYGRVCVGQEMWKAHRLAWFLVMGTLPRNSLYHVGKGDQPFSRVHPGAGVSRGCVRPHHFRDGPSESAPSRWAARAQSGFPPEFQSVTDRLMSTAQAATDLMPLLLYQGNLTLGRAQALFNFTMAAQAAEAERLGDVVAMSRGWPDMTHAVGLHKPITSSQTVGRFWDRLLDHKPITDAHAGMRDYVKTTMAATGERSIRLTPIDRYSPSSTRGWRKLRRPTFEPVPSVWPFIQGEANADHDLVMAVDRAVPKSLPEYVRQDACQDLMLAVLEGEVQVADLADTAEQFIRGAFRLYPSKYGPLSLDAPRGETERTLHDTLADAPIILGGGLDSLASLRDRLAAQEAVARA